MFFLPSLRHLMIQAGANSEPDRALLDAVWGEVPKRQTTAIMGPSGAGKCGIVLAAVLHCT